MELSFLQKTWPLKLLQKISKTDYLEEIYMTFLNDMLPETAEAFGQMRNSIFKDSFLDVKTKELIAIASSVLMRCQFCVDAHSQRAIAAGATKEEIAEAISVAMFIAAGSQIGWTNIYTENIYDRIGRTLIRKPRNKRMPFPLLGERTKGEGERKTQIKLIEHPPSSQPSPQEEGETFAASLKNLRLDWPDGLPEKQKRELAVPSPRGRRLG